jgi:uracil-DNA glycosylase
MAHCLPYLLAQIDIVGPQGSCGARATAAKGLLGPKSFGALGEVRGRWHEFGGRPLMVTYHPSYILATRRTAPSGSSGRICSRSWSAPSYPYPKNSADSSSK